jgi:hypothetical protein
MESLEHGYFGGYLIVNALGRPLEFHCSAPVRPSRAQEILYGPTLPPYLLGEQISGALFSAAKLSPHVILVDQSAVLPLRSKLRMPLVLVQSPKGHGASAYGTAAADSSIGNVRHELTAFDYELQLPVGYENDEQQVAELLSALTERVDLAEPFGRIHEAIREAQRLGARGNEAHDQAA